MPRKQKQNQTQKQTVIVNISEPRKRKRGGRRRKTAPRDGVSSMQRDLPPPVIYQSTYSIPYPVQAPPPIQAPVRERGFLTDVGQVGTEGRVEILDQLTKKEQQSEMITPVPSQIGAFRDTEAFSRAAKDYWTGKQADVSAMAAPPAQPEVVKTDDLSNLVMKVSRKEELFKQKMEMPEIQTRMEQVMVKGFPESGLTQTQKSIADQIPVDREALTVEQQYEAPKKQKKQKAPQQTPEYGAEAVVAKPAKPPRIPRPVREGPPAKGTVAYYKNQYKELTGREYVSQKGEKKQDLINAVKFEMTTTKA